MGGDRHELIFLVLPLLLSELASEMGHFHAEKVTLDSLETGMKRASQELELEAEEPADGLALVLEHSWWEQRSALQWFFACTDTMDQQLHNQAQLSTHLQG